MTLTDTTTLGQREPGSNSYKGILYIPLSSKSGFSASNGWLGVFYALQRYCWCILQSQPTGMSNKIMY